MNVTFKILLGVAVIALIYMCYSSVFVQWNFENEAKLRQDIIALRLIDIRKAQIEYKNIHKEHTPSFDTLAKFLNEEKLPFLVKEGVLTDDQLEQGMTEQEAVKKGIIRRDTIWVTAKDTLFGKDFVAEDLRYVPGMKIQFSMDTATISSGSGYIVKVFEAGVKYNDYLGDLDKQLLFNLNELANTRNKYAGLRVGSLTEINNNAGNWEDL
ncbi:MAG: hypothetical protein LBJ58_03395 [Tannerellaceae bacterium]|jgi:hypothetical protein|nr:hypothetical protein [Tannerellaceae bacterium]